MQGALEIPMELTIKTEHTEKSQLYIKKYEALIWKKYKEPVDGKFEDPTAAIFDGLQLSEAEENSDNSELELEL